jgi:hypothetical protein
MLCSEVSLIVVHMDEAPRVRMAPAERTELSYICARSVIVSWDAGGIYLAEWIYYTMLIRCTHEREGQGK